MEKEKFTFRQKWFPTFDDADEIAQEKSGDNLSIGVGQLLGRWIRSLVLGVGLIYGGYQSIGNNLEYSEGQRVGVVNKISKKGLIWKTKEGQLSLEGRTSTGDYTGAGVWDFSIDKLAKHGENVDELYSKINEYMEEGRRVKIDYKQPLAIWPWRAETRYLVQSVEPLEFQKK
jgi:hypothetical protein